VPSIRAASSISTGTARKNPVSNQIEKGSVNAAPARITPSVRPSSPVSRYSRNKGINSTTGENIWVMRIRSRNGFRPRKSSRAST
jgi:hypothetical protein